MTICEHSRTASGIVFTCWSRQKARTLTSLEVTNSSINSTVVKFEPCIDRFEDESKVLELVLSLFGTGTVSAQRPSARDGAGDGRGTAEAPARAQGNDRSGVPPGSALGLNYGALRRRSAGGLQQHTNLTPPRSLSYLLRCARIGYPLGDARTRYVNTGCRLCAAAISLLLGRIVRWSGREIACSALSLARSAQAERDNESCFFVRAAGVHRFIRRYHVKSAFINFPPEFPSFSRSPNENLDKVYRTPMSLVSWRS
ncbi:hypothetical protein EVAR_34748_1 [Eumeta japonica]|uniref:Uncharacterized protein n=1 Tax=Eumeta variegata TaxID=151549 RepID=A0A4C1YG84_EUMVA|nr:hypothetical protein EVAR_34748_1 [Eumeta japonica]